MYGMYKLLVEKDSNYNPAIIIMSRKNRLFFFLTLLTTYSCFKICAKYMLEEFISNCKTVNAILMRIFYCWKEVDRSKKVRSFWFIRFSVLCVSQLYIIGILNFSWSLHTNKPQVLCVWSNDLVFCHEREHMVQTTMYTVLCYNIDSLHNTLQVIVANKAKPKQKLNVPDII